MSGKSFIDTNVLVYAVDAAATAKRRIALDLLSDDSHEFVLSAQVLSEFFVVVTRRLPQPMTADAALQSLRELAQLPTVPMDSELVLSAADLARGSQLSLWDAQIVRAAQIAGCDRLLTEDLTDGAVYEGVRVENPFAVDART